MPDFPPLEDAGQPEPSIDEPEVQVHIPETLAAQPDHVEGRPPSVPDPASQSGGQESNQQLCEIPASERESAHDQDDNKIAGPSESEAQTAGVVVTEVPVEVPATELPPEVEENDGVDADEADYSVGPFDDEDLDEPVPPDATLTSSNEMSGRAVEGAGDESTESSATLESSAHGGVELSYDPEDGQLEDPPDEGHENSQAEAVTAVTANEETPPPQSNELVETQSQANGLEIDEEAIEHDELDDSEAHELPIEKTGETSAQEDHQSAAPETGSSPGTSEYEEYEEYEDQVELTAYPDEETTHNALLDGPEHVAPDNDPAKTPPVSNVTRITPPGKRTLEEREAEEEYGYGLDEFYETAAKRARVE